MLLSPANHRRAGWLALFALWLQLALSFGHSHAEDFAGFGAPPHPETAQVVADRSVPPGAPAPYSGGLAHDDCAICAAMALADSLVLADLGTAPAPTLVGARPLAIPDTVVLVDGPHRLFQTRAPPVA
jgi:hypothetical protein